MFKVLSQEDGVRNADNCTRCGMVGYGKLLEDVFVCNSCLTKNHNIPQRDQLFDDEFKEAYNEKMRDSTIYTGDDVS